MEGRSGPEPQPLGGPVSLKSATTGHPDFLWLDGVMWLFLPPKLMTSPELINILRTVGRGITRKKGKKARAGLTDARERGSASNQHDTIAGQSRDCL